MINERKVEQIIEKILKIEDEKIELNFQGITRNEFINKCLKEIPGKPSYQELELYVKNLGKSFAKPDFIVTNSMYHNLIIVIEAKNNAKKHISSSLYDKPKDYAVDGALYYAKYLKKSYDVIAIGVSANDEMNLISNSFLWRKNEDKPVEITKKIGNLRKAKDYFDYYKDSKDYEEVPRETVRKLAFEFHGELRKLGFTESEKPLFISNLLLCLTDESFKQNFQNIHDFDGLSGMLKSTLERVFEESSIASENSSLLVSRLKKDLTNKKLEKATNLGNGLHYFLKELKEKIAILIEKNLAYDVMGDFYHEFIKYSGGDGKGLGIVLTPYHIAEFFVDLLNVKGHFSEESVVIDIASGTGSFLVAAMKGMFNKVGLLDKKKKDIIRSNNIIGVELNTDMQLMSIANMIFNHDGRTNIFKQDSLHIEENENAMNFIKKNRPNIGLMNPPYSQGEGETELDFTLKLLDIIQDGGYAVTISPLSTATNTKFKTQRRELFQKHTLLAVITMPADLFYPTAATNTCIQIWQSGIPHNSDKKTWFGILSDDGFVKDKKLGRLDKKLMWSTIKTNFLKHWQNEEEIEGVSVKRTVTWEDEWLAEAYVKTDYRDIIKSDVEFEKTIREFASQKIKNWDVLNDE